MSNGLKEFKCPENEEFKVTDEMKTAFDEDGYALIRNLMSKAELAHIEKALTSDAFAEHLYGVGDGAGKEAHVILWNHPGSDVTGMVSRCEKVAGSCEQFLGGDVYHYHSKLLTKPPKIGGRHVWHQDYGYWYQNGCLFPDMMTVFIAIDRCTKENACLQVLKSSHMCGRIQHTRVGGQMGAVMDRVDELIKIFPHQYVEMEPGDALFFHSNLLHCSNANVSQARRWAYLCAYNRVDNAPVRRTYGPGYTPLEKVPNSAILENQDFNNLEGKAFVNYVTDSTTSKGRPIPMTSGGK